MENVFFRCGNPDVGYSPQWGRTQQGIDQQNFNSKSISRKTTHPQSLNKILLIDSLLVPIVESTYLQM